MNRLDWILLPCAVVCVGIGVSKFFPSSPPAADGGTQITSAKSFAPEPDDGSDRERMETLVQWQFASHGESLEQVRQRLIQRTMSQATAAWRRIAPICAIAQIWGKKQWVKDLLLSLADPMEKETGVRHVALSTILQTWGQEEWVKELLSRCASPQDPHPHVQMKAMEIIALQCGKQPWVKELFLELTHNSDPRFCCGALLYLNGLWNKEGWLRDHLRLLVQDPGFNLHVRETAIQILSGYGDEQVALAELLLPLISNQETDKNLRATAISYCDRCDEFKEPLKAPLMRIVTYEFSDESAGVAAFTELALAWPDDTDVRDLAISAASAAEPNPRIQSRAREFLAKYHPEFLPK